MSERRGYSARREMPQLRHCLRSSPFGPFAVVWSRHRDAVRVVRVVLSEPGVPAGRTLARDYPRSTAESCPEVELLADQLNGFLDGEDRRFPLRLVRLDRCSSFQQGVLRAGHAVPRGHVSTYRRIAAHLGSPAAARAVGRALAANPFPFLIPCHRLVRSDGSLGGYQGGLPMKRALLELEGVRFDARGRVLPEQFHY